MLKIDRILYSSVVYPCASLCFVCLGIVVCWVYTHSSEKLRSVLAFDYFGKNPHMVLQLLLFQLCPRRMSDSVGIQFCLLSPSNASSADMPYSDSAK